MGQFRRMWRGVQRVVVASCVAMVVVGVGMKVNRELWPAGVIDERLRERAAEVTIDMRSLEDAVRSLQSSFKTKVELTAQNHWVGSGKGELRLRDATLGQAVAAVIRRFDEKDEELNWTADSDAIRIHPIRGESEPLVVRGYDVGAYLQGEWTAAHYVEGDVGGHMERPAESLINLVESLMGPEMFDVYGGNIPVRLRIWGRFLIVRAPESMQRKVEVIIYELGHAAGQLKGKAEGSGQ